LASNIFGIFSLIFGILGFLVAPLIFGILALIFGLIGLGHDENKTIATIGLILGIIVLVLVFTGFIRWAIWRIIR